MDPQVGFLHALRPGRPALALDLMEELRPAVADRLALTLVNRGQVGKEDFEEHQGGAVYFSESGRRTVIVAYQKRKQEEVEHRVLGRKAPVGLVPHLQARSAGPPPARGSGALSAVFDAVGSGRGRWRSW